MLSFEDGGRIHEPKNAKNAALEAEKVKKMDSPLEPTERPCRGNIALLILISAQ